jgi:hypothetical protein
MIPAAVLKSHKTGMFKKNRYDTYYSTLLRNQEAFSP